MIVRRLPGISCSAELLDLFAGTYLFLSGTHPELLRLGTYASLVD